MGACVTQHPGSHGRKAFWTGGTHNLLSPHSTPGSFAGRQRDLQWLLAQGSAGKAEEELETGECPWKAVGLITILLYSQETQRIPTEEVQLEVLLSNGQKVKVNILTSDQTEDVLEVSAFWGRVGQPEGVLKMASSCVCVLGAPPPFERQFPIYCWQEG